MRYLLDVNVLIALIDRYHIHHDLAHSWLRTHSEDGWATCAITENGLVRIVSNKKYPQSPGSASTLVDMLSTLKYAPEHEFWSETISLTDDRIFRIEHISSPEQITDTYLLGLAVYHGGYFATFDRRLSTEAVIGGQNALHVIGD
ncbi:PIN domain-containing protein [Pararhizobium sp. YC-54]|nr:PIN domain-containing protein [Pararhizobium sp. YC-54]